MSDGGPEGEAHKVIAPGKMIAFGVLGGLISIYAAHFLVMINPAFSFIGSLGAICAMVWGSDAVRRVCSYGLGTGVPSIGMIALGMGVVASMFGLAVGGTTLAGPVIALIAAAIIGLVIGFLANKVLGMNIPVMEKSMVEIGSAGALAIVGLSTTMAGTFMFAEVLELVVVPGYIAVIFIAGGMGILHPFNACLGPDEEQDRTLAVSFEKGGIAMIVAGVVSMVISTAAAITTIMIGVFIWYISFAKFYELTKRDAYKVLGTGLLPTEEELQ